MELDEVIRSRRSIRGYLKKPVPKQVIREILDIASRAPSSMNSQPWHVHVITGDVLDRVRAGNTEKMLAGAPVQREIVTHGPYEGEHRKRQVAIAVQLFEAMGIARDDKDRRQDWVLRGFRQFDAPVSLVLTFDRDLEPGAVAHFDVGALSHAIVLAAWNRGLGCVINGQGIMQSGVVREIVGIPDNEIILTCIAMGYPDDSFEANAVVSTREPVEKFAVFHGFED